MGRRQQSEVRLQVRRRHLVVGHAPATARKFSQSTVRNSWMLSESECIDFCAVRLPVASKIELHFPDLFSFTTSHVNCCLSCVPSTALLALCPSPLSLPSSAGTYHTTDLEIVVLWTVPTAVWSVLVLRITANKHIATNTAQYWQILPILNASIVLTVFVSHVLLHLYAVTKIGHLLINW